MLVMHKSLMMMMVMMMMMMMMMTYQAGDRGSTSLRVATRRRARCHGVT